MLVQVGHGAAARGRLAGRMAAQELTAQGLYTRAGVPRAKDCAPKPTRNSPGYCVRSGTTPGEGATHGSLRRLVVPADASPTRHVECRVARREEGG